MNNVLKKPTPEQMRAANPAHSAWVAASAGSGKTQVLVDRVIRLMLAGAEPDSILCLTFTKAAAAEMAGRLFERLSEWIALDDADLSAALVVLGVSPVEADTLRLARTLFAKALETPGGLKIQTIHAFCERLLQLFPVESGMAPGFRVMEGQEADALFRDALLQSLSSDDTASQSAWAFLNDGDVASLEALEKMMKPFLSSSTGMRQRLSNFEQLAEIEGNFRTLLGLPNDRTADDIEGEIVAIDRDRYRAGYEALLPFEKNRNWGVFKAMKGAIEANGKEERLRFLHTFCFTEKGEKRRAFFKPAAEQKHPDWSAWLIDEASRLVALFELLACRQVLEANLTIYRAMAGVLARVNIEKQSRGLYDFDDLIARTVQLLQGHEAAQWVLYKLDRGLQHILVDEAQDTSPAQWMVIQALAGEFFTGGDERPRPRTVFAVGDVKQSIFSFQGADIAAFETARAGFKAALLNSDQQLQDVDLTLSYRSSQVVLDAVDQTFAPMTAARQGFGPRAEHERPHTAFHDKRPGRVELWQLELKPDEDRRDRWMAPVDTPPANHPRLVLAERIANAVHTWVGKRKRTGSDHTVQPGDILILVQRRKTIFDALIGALRRRGVPVAGADRLQLQDSLIVKDLVMLGQVLRLPRDDHALACVLKSPLVPEPLSEETLFSLAHDRGTESLWNRLPETCANRRMLSRLMQSQDTPFLLFSQVLQQSRRAIRERLGLEAEDAAEEFLTLALDYENTYGVSLSGFLDWLQAGETEIKREMDQGGGAVRIMTTHSAKGLEAPIVILADAADGVIANRERLVTISEGPCQGLQLYVPETLMKPPVIDVLKQQQKQLAVAESMRLLYVAMTRARDELYICGALTEKTDDKVPKDSWYPQVAAAFERSLGAKSQRVTLDDGFTILRFGAEPVDVVEDDSPAAPTLEVPEWATTPFPPAAEPPPVMMAARDSDAYDREAVARGAAIHRVIEMMADVPGPERMALGTRLAAKLRLDAGFVQQLVEQLARPELAPFFRPDAQSEVSIEGKVAGIGHIAGRIDRLLIASDGIYLLDYKTNRHVPESLSPQHPYVKQMARYGALLVEAYPDLPVRAALLWTETGRIMWLPQDLLSQALDASRQEMA